MKKYISVFMLYARSSLFRLLALLAAMAAAELAMFYSNLGKHAGSMSLTLERMVEGSGAAIFMAAAFVLMSVQLAAMGCEFGSRQGYTLRRLSISEKGVFAMQALFNASMYFVLWAVQLFLAMFMCCRGAEKMGELANGQSIFLAFYRSGFLHSLLPLEEWTRSLRNICLIAALGLASALFSYNQRRKKPGIAIIFMLPAAALPFAGSTGNLGTDVVQIFISALVAWWCLYRVFGKDWGNEA